MTYENLAQGGLNYFPCRYGTSRLLFRGPRRRIEGAYAVAIGGTETYGKFVEQPFADLLEDHTGLPVINFGSVNAGVDVFCGDEAVLTAASGARAVILQLMGAHNLSNRYYTVHPRRNDRFLKASPLLRMLYPSVDFSEFNFTRHLIQALSEADEERFAAIRTELRSAWSSRMASLISAIRAPVVLLWMADRASGDPSDLARASDPLFVSAEMIEALRPRVAGVVDARPSADARAAGNQGMIFAPHEAAAATEVPNARHHAEAAQALAKGLKSLI